MFYRRELLKDDIGQTERDFMRIKGLEARGYSVYTADDKHYPDEVEAKRHFNGIFSTRFNFSDFLNRNV